MTNPAFQGRIPVLELSGRVKLARETAGLTQPRLAELIGVSRATLANVEQGNRKPRRGELIAIAFATDVNLFWLETGKTPAEGNPPNGGEAWALRGSNPGPAD
ncbi:helix-turn-helix transcriptional regulator [Corynebacterium diphtheriae]|uniref:helix-turn-helix transcriptional regulator n=1 Tax=Corynebacterium diphtheriae TaxID=1717 RepID=UPI000F223A1A|nr:helix-turn-helix transcriptional regulator [Corynebacterium diphtheriae]RLP10540.1 XRE family transcriptional regulator [Corynebacterium diphtheriae]